METGQKKRSGKGLNVNSYFLHSTITRNELKADFLELLIYCGTIRDRYELRKTFLLIIAVIVIFCEAYLRKAT